MIEKLLTQQFAGNTIFEYLMSIIIVFITVILVALAKKFIIKACKKYSKKTKTVIDDFLVVTAEKIFLPFAYIVGLYLGIKSLRVSPQILKIVEVIFAALATFFIAKLLVRLIDVSFRAYTKKRGDSVSLKKSMGAVEKMIRVLVWGVALVFFLDNIGFKVSTVIAGLGIGGIAVGLAAQAVLKDLFSYFSILFDQPFEVGDFIIVGDYMGVIEYIGAKTTRIRSLGGEQLIFSNTDLTDSRLRNYKRMEKRRVVFKLGVIYQTSTKQIKQAKQSIKDIISGVKDTVFDRAHFFSYGDFSLNFEVVYYVLGNDYNKYMDIQEDINLKIKDRFKELGIEFAYPTQTLFVEKGK